MNKFKKKIKKILCRNWEDYALYCSDLGVSIGKNCSICKNVEFGSEPYLVKIGDNVKISSGVSFITHDGGMHVLRQQGYSDIDLYGKITIGNNVFIGMRVMILPNVNIGDNCVIGAGSIITKDIPSNSVVAGIPGKVINSIEDYKNRNLTKVDFTHNMGNKEKREYLIHKYTK